MIIGLGTDVVEIHRVARVMDRHSQRFARRVLSEREYVEFEQFPPSRKVEFLAGRFAAKEAIAKATGLGLSRMAMHEVDVFVAEQGLCARGPTMDAAGYRWHLSITHTHSVAFAVAICESCR